MGGLIDHENELTCMKPGVVGEQMRGTQELVAGS